MGKMALVTGSTGLVGTHLIDQLISNHHFQKIYAIQRRKTERSHVKLKELVDDLDELDSVDLPEIDIAFCCLGTTMKQAGSKDRFKLVDFTYVIQTAEKAKAQGASTFCVVSAMGANANSSIFYNKVKGEVEEKLKAMNFETLHIFRPSMLVGNRKENRLGEKIGIAVFKFLDPIMRGPLAKYRASDSEKVATQMVEKSLNSSPGLHIWEADCFVD